MSLSTKLSGFHVCVDKGTFDAISLNPDNAVEKRKQYVMSLSRVLEVKGFFLITSCNWTKAELLDVFSEGNWLHGIECLLPWVLYFCLAPLLGTVFYISGCGNCLLFFCVNDLGNNFELCIQSTEK